MESCDLFIVRNIRITKAIQPSDVIRYYPYVVIPYHRRTVMFTSTEHLLMDGQRKWTARSNGSEIQHYLKCSVKNVGRKSARKFMVSNV